MPRLLFLGASLATPEFEYLVLILALLIFGFVPCYVHKVISNDWWFSMVFISNTKGYLLGIYVLTFGN